MNRSGPHSSSTPAQDASVKRRGLLRGVFALRHSWAGLVATWREESAFRQEVCVAAVLLPIAALVQVSAAERVMLAASVLLVLLVELINSSIEAAIDRISLERHELSARAKDCGSAAVTIALVIAAMTWAVIGGPLAWHWLRVQL
ncbi:diacylglycerol kinase [Burkholderia sp. SFA1]|uniref:diacylglycerol kinase n=1 Tax=unclassified Caballeronia TaxID=2646786 RepID=UPI0002387C4C|nr:MULTISPECIES: diacylglycerol kinase [unclassified Caballeronia]AET89267.1 diacylglycerol kinase [Burkholderia sp. YI23]MCE4541684.1 diacylglycerol kinase [Caballeronia sp. PC1]MCE4569272.1 diacylglycerol kinase [Caballeronia sp. CLC5]BBP96423.1 diacylglycerol kinase [Burkholderia sp. SFA1]